ncbi:hypothetical protein BGZ68_008639 [Mortierella alpina]|nr:hypothetical protein BGZ68_008639 [Mortierella alpina]
MLCVFGYTGHNGQQVYLSNGVHDSRVIHSSIPRDIDKDVYADYSSIRSIELYTYREDHVGDRLYARILSFQMPQDADGLPMPEFNMYLEEHIHDEPEKEITFDELYLPENDEGSASDGQGDYDTYYND